MNLLLFGGMVFVLVFGLMGFAFLQSGELSEYEDISLFDSSALLAGTEVFFVEWKPLAFALGVFATLLRLEHLKSHIGEKRPSDSPVSSSNLSLFARFSKATLFCSVVFLLFLHDHFPGGIASPRSWHEIDPPDLVQSNVFTLF